VTRNRILFVVPALRRAGAESQLLKLVNGLSDREFEKHVVSYNPGDDLVADLDSNVQVHKYLRRRKIDIGVGRAIARIIDEYEIDIVHCTLLNALMYGLSGRVLATRKPPLVSVIHTTRNVDRKHDLAERFIYRPILKRASQVWFVSTQQAALWIKKMPFLAPRSRAIHNGIDVEYFNPDLFREEGRVFRERLGIATDEKVICCVAGLRPEKLHDVLIRAFNVVHATGLPCRLLLAGEGKMNASLRQLVAELKLEGQVHFLGALSDVRPLLATADCKVLSSAAETFSMAMLEAMAMGVPVISTEIGGAGEAIEDGVTGALVPAGNEIALAESIANVLQDEGRRAQMGACARETVVRSFRAASMIENSTAALNELLADK
jgi:glycosyltransferase involved in cell wall biosynthesis